MLTCELRPMVIGGAGRIAQHQPALFFAEAPEVGNGKKRPERRRAQPPAVGRREARLVEDRFEGLERLFETLPRLRDHAFSLSRSRYSPNLDKRQEGVSGPDARPSAGAWGATCRARLAASGPAS